VLGENGAVTGIVAFGIDLTERNRYQEQLILSDRLSSAGMLASSVAHEINNPLSALMGNVQYALGEFEEGVLGADTMKEIHDCLGESFQAADRIRNIVGDLRIFCHPRDGSTGPVDVNRVMESTLRVAMNEIRHRAKLIKNLNPVPNVLADESSVGQVFLNLLVNAAHSIEVGSASKNEISVTTSCEKSRMVTIRISDTGEGISKEELSLVFTPFHVDSRTGKGMGLSICSNIIKALGGEISVESEQGKGCTFTVSLPIAVEQGIFPEGMVEKSKGRTRGSPPSRRGRILVLDDEEILGNTVRRVMEGLHDVVAVTEAGIALGMLRNGEHFNLILSDVMMPEMNGMDFYNEVIKLNPPLAKSMVFMTGGTFTPRTQEFLDRIPNKRISKPFNVVELRSMLNMLMAEAMGVKSLHGGSRVGTKH
jgi:nitrogen-specific signal transduction histidine kinase